MRRRALLAVVAAVVATAAASAAPAGAVIYPPEEPVVTRPTSGYASPPAAGTQNDWWFRYRTPPGGNGSPSAGCSNPGAGQLGCPSYRYCFSYGQAGGGATDLGCFYPDAIDQTRYKGVALGGLTNGSSWFACGIEQLFSISLNRWQNTTTQSWCDTTTIDTAAPTAAVSLNNGAQYTKSATLTFRLTYADGVSVPWPATWICSITNRACGGADNASFAYIAACSGYGGSGLTNRVAQCDRTYGGADGPVHQCALTADSAVRNNPGTGVYATDNVNGPDQGAYAFAQYANLSSPACDSIVVDRAAPTLDAQASDTSVLPGETVTFTASSSDATSGATGAYAWNFADGTTAGGTSPSKSWSSAGTYDVTVQTADNAGNTASRQLTITVGTPPPPDGDRDGVADGSDNCPAAANADQKNTDGDTQGDACDADDDGDGVADTADGCPLAAAATATGTGTGTGGTGTGTGGAGTGTGGAGTGTGTQPGGGETGPGGTTTTGGPGGTAGGVVAIVTGGRARAVRRGRRVLAFPGLTLGCPAGGAGCAVTVSGSARIAGRKVALGTTKLTVRPGATRAVALTLSKKGAAALKRAGRLRMTFAVTATAGGAPATAKRTATLRAPS